jgi:adenosine deaminase
VYWSCDKNLNSLAFAKFFRMWWPETGSNRRRRPFQGRALPLSYLALAFFRERAHQAAKIARRARASQLRLPVGEGITDPSDDRAFENVDSQYSNHLASSPNLIALCGILGELNALERPLSMVRAHIALSLFISTTLCCAVAQTQSSTALTPGEARATHAMDAAAKMGPGEIYAFLKPFPKGADLHMHLSGAVYAETFIAEAAREGLCIASVDRGTPATPTGQDAVHFVKPLHSESNDCAPGQVTAASAFKNQPLYDDLIDSFSMRAFVPTEGIDGHDQFFSTFDRFGGLKSDAGEWLDEVSTRAAAQNEQYLEIMQTPTFSHAAAIGYKIGWPADAAQTVTPAELSQLRDQLLAGGVRDEVPTDIKEFNGAETSRNTIEHCDASDDEAPACHIRIHWLYQVLRGFPPQQVFAQTLLGFEVASVDPDVVGLNFVMPEDGYLSMRDYHLQMQMLDYLHSVYPKVRISLHAGELAPGMVPPAGLSFHIREAIDLGHATRIGHGVDVLYEDHPEALLKEMADKHVMVEVNLTSNDGILGIKGNAHPLHAYMAAHVPWALSTDDEGVSRIDLTHEYVKAVEEQALTYVDLKRSARTSLEHAFLHGESLWATPDDFTHRRSVCESPITATSKPSDPCASFLNANEKADAQWELEHRFAVFEAAQH